MKLGATKIAIAAPASRYSSLTRRRGRPGGLGRRALMQPREKENAKAVGLARLYDAVVGQSLGTGTGVVGESPGGTGVVASGRTALKVQGPAVFSRSGVLTVAAGHSSATKTGVALTAGEPGAGHHPGQRCRSVRAGSDPCYRGVGVVHDPPEQDRPGQDQGRVVRRQLRPQRPDTIARTLIRRVVPGQSRRSTSSGIAGRRSDPPFLDVLGNVDGVRDAEPCRRLRQAQAAGPWRIS